MSEFFTDTSYKQQYVVVSTTDNGVYLRPVDDSAICSYWKEFISGYINEPVPDEFKPTLYLYQLPPEVLVVDAYTDYTVEYPRVEILYGTKSIDISDKVTVNHPNPETPGLYALDFMVSATDDGWTTIWRSWLSIEEVPLLRSVITPWNKDNKTIANINRLVIEPQFTEALYEAGVPVYNFQQANANMAVSQFAMQSYRNARAFVKAGRLFVTGPRLPIGTMARIGGTQVSLRESALNSAFCRDYTYVKGDIVSYCGSDYYAVYDIPTISIPSSDGHTISRGSMLPTDTTSLDGSHKQYWVQGCYYVTDTIPLEDGEYTIESLWAIIDVNGYLFKMDLTRALQVHHYWGHYNRKYFYDYAPGDLVSVIKDNMISLYQRNDTSLDSRDLEEAYRPGHYKNPHWTEVYSEINGDEVVNPAIRPYTNATNAIVSKTYSAREESFRLYSNLVGIPSELVDMLGAKYSVILWALLYRTRETFPGLRAALNAIGLDIGDLHRSTPSIMCTDGDGKDISNIYDEISIVKKIARSVELDRVWVMENGPKPTEIDRFDPNYDVPWITYSKDGNTVLRYDTDSDQWYPYYTFKSAGVGNLYEHDFTKNNRYYSASIGLLGRLSGDGALDLGDGVQWINDDYFTSMSIALTRLLEYEIPIYVYLRLKISLATIGNARVRGVSNGVLHHYAWGGKVGLKVFPGKVFNSSRCRVESYYPTILYAYEYPGAGSLDSDWSVYTDSEATGDGSRYYSFDSNVYIRMVYNDKMAGNLYVTDTLWTSRYSLGCFGDGQSNGTENALTVSDGFVDASIMPATGDITHGPDCYLCKGVVGCTLRINSSPDNISVAVDCLQWEYVFGDPKWKMDEVLKFADWEPLEGAKFYGNWSSTAESFKSSISRVSSPDTKGLVFDWGSESTPTLYVGGGIPNRIDLYDMDGYIRGTIVIPYSSRMVLDEITSSYTLRISISAQV